MDNMIELQEKLEQAKRQLAKAMEAEDWDGILNLSMDVYDYQRELEETL